MCSIAGIVSKNNSSVNRQQIDAMLSATAHRGPDGSNSWQHENVTLGHNRLSIIDLTDAGAQPMTYKHLTLTYNGELYNYLEVKEALLRKGYQFTGHSDTEVLLKAFDCWGEKCFDSFNGMWALAIYDSLTRELFLSRDRFGEKPLYYAFHHNQFFFCSEIKGLLAAGVPALANAALIAGFLVNERAEHEEETFFAGIKKLRAGHHAVLHTDTLMWQTHTYYMPGPAALEASMSVDDAAALFTDALKRSVAWRMRSDVPVGTCLSGGLDSSTIAILASGLQLNTFHAITAAIQEVGRNEAVAAAALSAEQGWEHHAVYPSEADLLENLDDLVYTQEEPFVSLSVAMQYFVMKKAHALGLKVLLDGQGADELLLGYKRYFPALRQMGLLTSGKNSWRRLMDKNDISFTQMAALLVYHGRPRLTQKRRLSRWKNLDGRLLALLHPDKEETGPLAGLAALHTSELTRNSLPALLRYEDKNAMRFSVETRLPFLDHRLAELCIGLPVSFKLRYGYTKYLLRECMKHKLPQSIAWRKGKQAFEAPEQDWVAALPQHIVANSDFLSSLCKAGKLPSVEGPHYWRLYAVAAWAGRFGVAPLA